MQKKRDRLNLSSACPVAQAFYAFPQSKLLLFFLLLWSNSYPSSYSDLGVLILSITAQAYYRTVTYNIHTPLILHCFCQSL